MSLSERLDECRQVFLDTAPVIYFVESNPSYATKLTLLFEKLDAGEKTAVISPITLAECLVIPFKSGNTEVAHIFIDLLVNSGSVWFYPIDETIAEKAAELRSRYNLTLADAFQIAVAIQTGCDAFLTNDKDLKRVTELPILVLSE